jgi:Zn-dependent protease with chaperone function
VSPESPKHRQSFFEERERWRRRTWRASFVCGLAALVMGAPLAVLATPVAALVIGLVLKTVPGGEPALERFRDLVGYLSESRGVSLYLLLIPGMVLLLVLWFWFRARVRDFGAAGLAASLGARPPRADDIEEIQMGNVVEEMAIASGSPQMKLLLLDQKAANAAALGSTEGEAVLVVSRGLLESLDREQTQAVAGHLIGSVANGDLRVLSSLNAVFQSVGFLLLAIDAAFALSCSAARDVVRAIRLALGFTRDPVEAAAIEEVLAGRILELRQDGLHGLTADLRKPEPETKLGKLTRRFPPLYAVIAPFALLYVLSLVLRWQVFMLRLLLAGPMVMWVWRSRRHLADAAAVQLTRNPDALARALERLSIESDLLSKARWAEPLFVVGASRGEWSRELGGVVGSHPPLAKRLQRLAAMGGVDLSGKPTLRESEGRLTLRTILASPLYSTIISMFFVIALVSMVFAAIPAIGLTLLGLELVRALL